MTNDSFWAVARREAVSEFLGGLLTICVFAVALLLGSPLWFLIVIGVIFALFVLGGLLELDEIRNGGIDGSDRTENDIEEAIREWCDELGELLNDYSLDMIYERRPTYRDRPRINFRVKVTGRNGWIKQYLFLQLDSTIDISTTMIRQYDEYTAKFKKLIRDIKKIVPSGFKVDYCDFNDSIYVNYGDGNHKWYCFQPADLNPDYILSEIETDLKKHNELKDKEGIELDCREYLNERLYGNLRCFRMRDSSVDIGYIGVEVSFHVEAWEAYALDSIVELAHEHLSLGPKSTIEKFVQYEHVADYHNGIMEELEVLSFKMNSDASTKVTIVELTLRNRKESVNQYLSRLEKARVRLHLVRTGDERLEFNRVKHEFTEDFMSITQSMNDLIGKDWDNCSDTKIAKLNSDVCSICGAEACEHLWFGELGVALKERGFSLSEIRQSLNSGPVTTASRNTWKSKPLFYTRWSIKETTQKVEDEWFYSLVSLEREAETRTRCIETLRNILGGLGVSVFNIYDNEVSVERSPGTGVGGLSLRMDRWDTKNVDSLVYRATRNLGIDVVPKRGPSYLDCISYFEQILPDNFDKLGVCSGGFMISFRESIGTVFEVKGWTYDGMMEVAKKAYSYWNEPIKNIGDPDTKKKYVPIGVEPPTLNAPAGPDCWNTTITPEKFKNGILDIQRKIESIGGLPQADFQSWLTDMPPFDYKPSAAARFATSGCKKAVDAASQEMHDDIEQALAYAVMYHGERRTKPFEFIHIDLSLSETKRLGICNSDSKPITRERKECLGIATKELLK